MSKNYYDTLIIMVPPSLFDMPVKIIRGNGANELVCYLKAESEQISIMTPQNGSEKYVFIRCNDSYKKVEIANILWVKADRSYSEVHLKDNTTMVLSSPLSEVERSLSSYDFIRIHRSFLLNIKYVDRMCGNTLYVGRSDFTIGREYRERVQQRMIFIGVRNRERVKSNE